MKFFDAIKLGLGFFIGYEIGKNVKEMSGDIYEMVKKRIEKGYI